MIFFSSRQCSPQPAHLCLAILSHSLPLVGIRRCLFPAGSQFSLNHSFAPRSTQPQSTGSGFTVMELKGRGVEEWISSVLRRETPINCARTGGVVTEVPGTQYLRKCSAPVLTLHLYHPESESSFNFSVPRPPAPRLPGLQSQTCLQVRWTFFLLRRTPRKACQIDSFAPSLSFLHLYKDLLARGFMGEKSQPGLAALELEAHPGGPWPRAAIYVCN